MDFIKKAVDHILEGADVRTALEEGSELSVDSAVAKVGAWLANNTYDFRIRDITPLGVKVEFDEIDPNGEVDKNYFTVRTDGKIYNSNGDDVVEVAMSATDDPEELKALKAFKAKYY